MLFIHTLPYSVKILCYYVRKALVYTTYYHVKHVCCLVQTVSYYVKRLCGYVHIISYYVKRLSYCVKNFGYLVYEICELVYTTFYYSNAVLILSTQCLIMVDIY